MGMLIICAFFVLLGYTLGIVGFFQAGAARRDLRELRRLIESDARWRSAPAVPAPSPATPPVVPEAVADPVDLEREAVAPTLREPPLPEPLPSSTPKAAPAEWRLPDLESVLSMRWAAYVGAVALLLASVFLIRYATDQGLLGPAPRCGAAALLGVALIIGAEWLKRRDVTLLDTPFAIDLAPPALAAGGIAVLFGAAYGAGPFYGLVPPSVAFVAMALAAFVGLLAALRFGPLTAAVGIVGAFATPALVASPTPSLIGLFAYIALVAVAAYEIVWRTAWTWLGWAVAGAGALWILVAATSGGPDLWAAALYGPLAAFLGLLLPSAAIQDARGRVLAWGQFAIIATAGLVLEAFAPGLAPRIAMLALAPIAVWKGIDEPALDRLPWLAAAIGLAALVFWDQGSATTAFREPIAGATSQPLLLAGFVFAVFHACVGFWFETRVPQNPIRWSVLTAAIPVLTLALCYALVGRFDVDIRWGLASLVLAAILVGATRRAVAAGARDRAGVHAAGAVAALTLALVMVLREQSLAIALALLLPGLCWVEGKVSLAGLRKVTLAVAIGVLILIARWPLTDILPFPRHAQSFGSYAIQSVLFFVASRMARRGGEDALVATLEAGAMGLASLFVLYAVRFVFGHQSLSASYGFDEIATLTLAFAAQAMACDRIMRRAPGMIVDFGRLVWGVTAAVLASGLLIFNPMVTDASVTNLSLLLAYLAPAAIASYAARRADPALARWLGGYAIVAGFAWLTLSVRLIVHPRAMGLFEAPVLEAELWAWSGAWLVYAVALMTLGIVTRSPLVRLAALGLFALVCVKVFLWDMADLTGLLRVASFLGLGLSLIALAAVHRRFVVPNRTDPTA